MSEEIFVSDGRLEAKVVSTTQNDKGWYVRLFLHPNDAAEVTKLRYGAVLDIRWREVLNVEVESIADAAWVAQVERPGPLAIERTREDAGATPAPRSKPKQRFADMPLSQQAGIRCEDAEFSKFIMVKFGTMNMSPTEFVRSRCGVASRAALDDPRLASARHEWTTLNSEFQAWQTDQKYADTRR